MGPFEEAQQFFKAFQKTGLSNNLRDSLELLDELIESNNADSHKAMNFKQAISRSIENQIQEILNKCNIPEFAKDLKATDDQNELRNQLATVLSSSLSGEDANLFLELMNITSHYFKKGAN
jgi:hypothetical protein